MLSTDTAEDGFHEIQLSGKQLVFLFMATTVVSVAIFLCGVMVGRGVRAEKGDDPIDAPALSASADAGSGTASEPPSVSADVPGDVEPPPPAGEDVTYPGRLSGEGTKTKEELKPKGDPDLAPPAANTSAPPSPEPPAAREPAVNVPTSGRPGSWLVQVTALQNRNAAAGIVQRLAGKGYPAYLQDPARGAPAIFRVRVGRFGSRVDAKQTARRLEKEEQFSPVVTR